MGNAPVLSLELTPSEEALIAYVWRGTTPPVGMWQALFDTAKQQGIGLLFAFLAAYEPHLPAALQARLRDMRYHAGIFHIRAEQQLRQISAISRELAIPLILLKGPITARAYPVPEARPFSDLDLLAPSEVSAQLLGTALEARGYIAAPADSRTGHLPPLQAPDGGLRVELHCSELEILPTLRADESLWGRTSPLPDLPGIAAMSPVDHALYFTIHALEKHTLEVGLRALVDFGFWVQHWDGATWDQLREQMLAQHLEPPMRLMLALWGWVQGVPWSELPLAASFPPPPDAILAQALEALFRRKGALLPTTWRDVPQGQQGWLIYVHNVLTSGGTLGYKQIPKRILHLLRTHGPGLFQLVLRNPETRRRWRMQRQLQDWLRHGD